MNTLSPANPERRRRGRPAHSSDDAAAARARILRSARIVFAQRGFHDATLQDIARLADVSRPAISHHFAEKTELYEAVFDETRETVIVSGAAHALGSSEHFTERISAFMEYTSSVGDADRSFTAFITASLLDTSRVPALSHLANRQLNDLRDFLRRVCTDAIASAEIPADINVDATVESMLAAIWGTALYVAYLADTRDSSTVIEHVGALLRTIVDR